MRRCHGAAAGLLGHSQDTSGASRAPSPAPPRPCPPGGAAPVPSPLCPRPLAPAGSWGVCGTVSLSPLVTHTCMHTHALSHTAVYSTRAHRGTRAHTRTHVHAWPTQVCTHVHNAHVACTDRVHTHAHSHSHTERSLELQEPWPWSPQERGAQPQAKWEWDVHAEPRLQAPRGLQGPRSPELARALPHFIPLIMGRRGGALLA